MESQEVVYHDERGTALSGYAAWMKEATEGGTARPGVLVAHTAIGPQEDFIREKVHQLAELGYVGFALDMFGAGHCVFGAEKEAANRVLKEDRPLIASRANAALGAMTALPVVDAERVGAIGYCLGGKVVLDLARSVPQGLRAVVSFHGILDAVGGDASWPLTAACLCYHGARDPFVSDADLLAFRDEMEAREAAYEVVMLGGCYHAFTRPEKVATGDRAAGLFYDKAAAEKSWAGACSFLKDHL